MPTIRVKEHNHDLLAYKILVFLRQTLTQWTVRNTQNSTVKYKNIFKYNTKTK